jgi:hypothetical protein
MRVDDLTAQLIPATYVPCEYRPIPIRYAGE